MEAPLTPQSLYDFWNQVVAYVPQQTQPQSQPQHQNIEVSNDALREHATIAPVEAASKQKGPIIYGNPIHDRYLTISP
jgi:hypothetical protein